MNLAGWRKHAAYWVTALAVLIGTVWAEPYFEQYGSQALATERNWLFQRLAQSVTNPATSQNVKLVLIRDDEYWDGDLHHRVPTDRRYLARLVRILDQVGAAVIALDFDERLPHTGQNAKPGDYLAVDAYAPYRQETDDLIRAIDDVATRRPIVLSRNLVGNGPPYKLGGDLFEAYGICTHLTADGQWDNPGTREFPLSTAARANISCGYIRLMEDSRRIPPPARIAGERGRLDSFPLAIARARSPEAIPDFDDRTSYYGTYIPGALDKDPHVTVSAHDLLTDPESARRVVQGWPVIVGAAWHELAAGSDRTIDIHDTPIGRISGALLNANVAETLLGHRMFPALSNADLTAIELLLGVLAALAFAAISNIWLRLSTIALAMIALIGLQWIVLQIFGAFLDAFVPVLSLGVHALAGRLIGEHNGH